MIEAYLVHGERLKRFKGWYGSSVRRKWEKELGLALERESKSAIGILEFHLYTDKGEELVVA